LDAVLDCRLPSLEREPYLAADAAEGTAAKLEAATNAYVRFASENPDLYRGVMLGDPVHEAASARRVAERTIAIMSYLAEDATVSQERIDPTHAAFRHWATAHGLACIAVCQPHLRDFASAKA